MWFLYIPAFFSGGLIPTYLQMKNLHLLNNPLVLVINGGLFTVGNCIILLNFFRNLPKGLSESAKIDGATHFDILFKIYLPVSMASVATLILFNMVGLWNEWFTGMIYLKDMDWLRCRHFCSKSSTIPSIQQDDEGGAGVGIKIIGPYTDGLHKFLCPRCRLWWYIHLCRNIL